MLLLTLDTLAHNLRGRRSAGNVPVGPPHTKPWPRSTMSSTAR